MPSRFGPETTIADFVILLSQMAYVRIGSSADIQMVGGSQRQAYAEISVAAGVAIPVIPQLPVNRDIVVAVGDADARSQLATSRNGQSASQSRKTIRIAFAMANPNRPGNATRSLTMHRLATRDRRCVNANAYTNESRTRTWSNAPITDAYPSQAPPCRSRSGPASMRCDTARGLRPCALKKCTRLGDIGELRRGCKAHKSRIQQRRQIGCGVRLS